MYHLYQPLIHHRIRYLKEAGDVRAIHVVTRRAVLFRGAMAYLMDCLHDVKEPRVYFFSRPGDAHAVLRHLQSRSSNAARIRSLARTEKDLSVEKLIYSLDCCRHVRAFRDDVDAVPKKV